MIAAEAITKKGITEELSPSRARNDCTALYLTVVIMQPIQNAKRDDLYTFLFAVRRFYQSDSM